MSLFGNLEDLPLPQLLQTVAANQLSGKLILTRRDGHGLLVFRAGKIIYAATNAARETIGNILVLRKLISASALTEALLRQGRSSEERRLGAILIEMGAVDEETLHGVMREQVEKVLLELFRWRQGFVKFEAMEIPEHGEVAVDAADFLVREGLPTDRLVFDLLDRLAAHADESQEQEILAVLGSTTGAAAPSTSQAGYLAGSSLASLKTIMTEIRTPAFTGEVTLGILRFAGKLLARGALFLHASGFVTGMGQFGIALPGAESADARVRRVRIPADEPSIFHEVIEKHETFRGPLEEHPRNLELCLALGGARPREAVAVPMLVGDRVALVFYGDNLPLDRPLPAIDELEVLMIQGGLAIEKALLEERLRGLEAARR